MRGGDDSDDEHHDDAIDADRQFWPSPEPTIEQLTQKVELNGKNGKCYTPFAMKYGRRGWLSNYTKKTCVDK